MRRVRVGVILRGATRRDASRPHLPKITTAASAIGPAKVLVMGLGVAVWRRSPPPIVWALSSRVTTCDRKLRNRRCHWAPHLSSAIPGRPSPKLIRKAQVAGMKGGAMIVDLSADGGGNCENTQPGEMTRIGQVTIVAPLKRAVAAPLGRQRTPASSMRITSTTCWF